MAQGLRWIGVGLLLIIAGVGGGIEARQADGDEPSSLPLAFAFVEHGTITETASFDWWQIEATQGEFVRVTMTGSDGLAPLLGLLDANRNLLTRSDEGLVNGTVQMIFEAPFSGMFIIVATRAGADQGTTTGAYTVRADVITEAELVNPYAEVTFRCNDYEAVTAAVVEFNQETDVVVYDVVIIGMGEMQPLFKVETSLEGDLEPCWDRGQEIEYALTLPDGMTYTQEDSRFARLLIDTTAVLGRIRLTFGSREGGAGRFAIIINGFTVNPADTTDVINVRNGPLAAQAHPLDVYMVRADAGSRLDPFISEEATANQCDDAGRRGCESMLAATAFTLALDNVALRGGRFDAGMQIAAGDLEFKPLMFGSRSGRTSGGYALLLIGELPPRE